MLAQRTTWIRTTLTSSQLGDLVLIPPEFDTSVSYGNEVLLAAMMYPTHEFPKYREEDGALSEPPEYPGSSISGLVFGKLAGQLGVFMTDVLSDPCLSSPWERNRAEREKYNRELAGPPRESPALASPLNSGIRSRFSVLCYR